MASNTGIFEPPFPNFGRKAIRQ